MIALVESCLELLQNHLLFGGRHALHRQPTPAAAAQPARRRHISRLFFRDFVEPALAPSRSESRRNLLVIKQLVLPYGSQSD